MSIENQIFAHYRQTKNQIKEAKDILIDNNYYILDLNDLSGQYDLYVKKQEMIKNKPLKYKKWHKKVSESLITLENIITD